MPLRGTGRALRSAFLRHGDLLAGGEGRQGHAEGCAERFLGVGEDGFEGAGGGGGEDYKRGGQRSGGSRMERTEGGGRNATFGVDVGAAEWLTGVFAREREADEVLDLLGVCSNGVVLGFGFVVGGGWEGSPGVVGGAAAASGFWGWECFCLLERC